MYNIIYKQDAQAPLQRKSINRLEEAVQVHDSIVQQGWIVLTERPH